MLLDDLKYHSRFSDLVPDTLSLSTCWKYNTRSVWTRCMSTVWDKAHAFTWDVKLATAQYICSTPAPRLLWVLTPQYEPGQRPLIYPVQALEDGQAGQHPPRVAHVWKLLGPPAE